MNFADLAEVNRLINTCPYKADPPGFDDWRPGPDGCPKDCDSYAVAKVRALFARGWPIALMRLATCLVEGVGHLVAVIAADDEHGDLVLTNGYDKPMPVADLERLGWVPLGIQEHGGSLNWVQWTGWGKI